MSRLTHGIWGRAVWEGNPPGVVASSWCGPVVTPGEDLGPQQDRLSPALGALHDPSVRAAQAAGGHWSGSSCGEGLGGDSRQPGRGSVASWRGGRALVCPGHTAICLEPVAGMGACAEGRQSRIRDSLAQK